MKKHIIHALRTHAKRTLAAAFAAAFALGSALTLSACSGKPAKQTGSNSTLVPQTEVPTVSATTTPAPAETATPFVNPTDPPATPVPVVGEYTKPCQKVKVDFPATDSTRAFSVTFDLPEGWTVRSDEGVYTDSSYSDLGFYLLGRKLLYDENGNLAGAAGYGTYDPNNHAENVTHEVYGSVVSGHVKLVNFENFHSTVDNSTNCISAYTSSHHECAPAMWTFGEGFHAFDNPAACAYTEENPVFVVIELSRLYEDSASLSKRVAESIRFE